MKTTAIIAAGGVGARLGIAGGKQLLEVCGRPVAAWAASAVAAARGTGELVIVCDPERLKDYEAALRSALATDKPLRFVGGGATRTASIAAGLAAVSADVEVVLIHDGARPLVTPDVVDAALAALVAADADIAGVVVGHPASDTLKTAGLPRSVCDLPRNDKGASQSQVRDSTHDGNEACHCEEPSKGARQPFGEQATALPLITGTLDRSVVWQVQTPQVFRAAALRDAYGQAVAAGHEATDDAGLLEAAGYGVVLFCGPHDNIKITVEEDVRLAEALLRARLADRDGNLAALRERIDQGAAKAGQEG
ncbi:MAG: 2-C-methyl-D-erythritol 4-phosphate cytidylyltransferase [Coriobacteriia bacterium]|nr:2-C-methyl-D-erythritol 4-phosphate cytidylyltransferase [Coriobacteriia bacterium]